GNLPIPNVQYPTLGSLAARLLPARAEVPPFVSFGNLRDAPLNLSGYLGMAYNPFTVEEVGPNSRIRGLTLPAGATLEQLQNRARLLQQFDAERAEIDRSSDVVEGLDTLHRQALQILYSDRTRNAFNLDRETATLRARYGANPFGIGAILARRLVEAGTRFV